MQQYGHKKNQTVFLRFVLFLLRKASKKKKSFSKIKNQGTIYA